ncbi:AMP-binding protein [Bathymodiolus japonicus methanotrophic gill symbiont]|uniref:AMP-binding protein n=1 Tax=Bathymodiolus japonicus methanotrophic gill symbiont TaxID=113269 RepID=UPI001C8D7DEA|nr:AMP-binding protein [Bathymodiolus japonicus methanotrophic gill symbiont]
MEKTLAMPFCICATGIMNRTDLLAHAIALSEKLPDKSYAINLCQNRYLFIVAYLAVCIRKQISLLPSIQAPKTLLELQETYPDSYRLGDNKSNCDFLITYDLLEKINKPFPLIEIDQPLSISFTSGSTGKPKAISKTWREFQASAELALQRFKLQNQQITLVSTVPMQHMYGLETSLFWVLFSQMMLHNSRPFYPQDICSTLNNISTDKILISTPRHLKSCSDIDSDWNAITFILSSTAPLEKILAIPIEQNLQAPLFELFGSTETLSFASRRVTLSEKWQPYTSIKLIKNRQQFVLQGGHITKAQILDDNFSIDSNGCFTLLGRSADLIKIAGKRASLSDLNHRLTSIDSIEDGVFFPGNNERLSAIVVSQLSRAEIIQHLKQSIDAVFMPRTIYSVSAIPRNNMGKIIKTELDQLIQACQLARK